LSVSVGVIANLGRQLPGLGEVDDRFYHDMLQITAPINPGNSGGPLFNIRGELIGVVTAMHTRAPADEGIGFAIPMSPAKRRVVDTLCQGRPVEYGYLGVVVRALGTAERAALHLGHGVVVQQVEPEGPAAQAGLSVGDLVLEFEHQAVTGPAQFAELAGQSAVGSVVRLEVLRNERSETLRLLVERRDVSRVSWMRGGAIAWRGMRLTDLSPDARRPMRGDSARRCLALQRDGYPMFFLECSWPGGVKRTVCFDARDQSDAWQMTALDAASAMELGYPYEFIRRIQGRW
jgi:serine protease Do